MFKTLQYIFLFIYLCVADVEPLGELWLRKETWIFITPLVSHNIKDDDFFYGVYLKVPKIDLKKHLYDNIFTRLGDITNELFKPATEERVRDEKKWKIEKKSDYDKRVEAKKKIKNWNDWIEEKIKTDENTIKWGFILDNNWRWFPLEFWDTAFIEHKKLVDERFYPKKYKLWDIYVNKHQLQEYNLNKIKYTKDCITQNKFYIDLEKITDLKKKIFPLILKNSIRCTWKNNLKNNMSIYDYKDVNFNINKNIHIDKNISRNTYISMNKDIDIDINNYMDSYINNYMNNNYMDNYNDNYINNNIHTYINNNNINKNLNNYLQNNMKKKIIKDLEKHLYKNINKNINKNIEENKKQYLKLNKNQTVEKMFFILQKNKYFYHSVIEWFWDNYSFPRKNTKTVLKIYEDILIDPCLIFETKNLNRYIQIERFHKNINFQLFFFPILATYNREDYKNFFFKHISNQNGIIQIQSQLHRDYWKFYRWKRRKTIHHAFIKPWDKFSIEMDLLYQREDKKKKIKYILTKDRKFLWKKIFRLLKNHFYRYCKKAANVEVNKFLPKLIKNNINNYQYNQIKNLMMFREKFYIVDYKLPIFTTPYIFFCFDSFKINLIKIQKKNELNFLNSHLLFSEFGFNKYLLLQRRVREVNKQFFLWDLKISVDLIQKFLKNKDKNIYLSLNSKIINLTPLYNDINNFYQSFTNFYKKNELFKFLLRYIHFSPILYKQKFKNKNLKKLCINFLNPELIRHLNLELKNNKLNYYIYKLKYPKLIYKLNELINNTIQMEKTLYITILMLNNRIKNYKNLKFKKNFFITKFIDTNKNLIFLFNKNLSFRINKFLLNYSTLWVDYNLKKKLNTEKNKQNLNKQFFSYIKVYDNKKWINKNILYSIHIHWYKINKCLKIDIFKTLSKKYNFKLMFKKDNMKIIHFYNKLNLNTTEFNIKSFILTLNLLTNKIKFILKHIIYVINYKYYINDFFLNVIFIKFFENIFKNSILYNNLTWNFISSSSIFINKPILLTIKSTIINKNYFFNSIKNSNIYNFIFFTKINLILYSRKIKMYNIYDFLKLNIVTYFNHWKKIFNNNYDLKKYFNNKKKNLLYFLQIIIYKIWNIFKYTHNNYKYLIRKNIFNKIIIFTIKNTIFLFSKSLRYCYNTCLNFFQHFKYIGIHFYTKINNFRFNNIKFDFIFNWFIYQYFKKYFDKYFDRYLNQYYLLLIHIFWYFFIYYSCEILQDSSNIYICIYDVMNFYYLFVQSIILFIINLTWNEEYELFILKIRNFLFKKRLKFWIKKKIQNKIKIKFQNEPPEWYKFCKKIIESIKWWLPYLWESDISEFYEQDINFMLELNPLILQNWQKWIISFFLWSVKNLFFVISLIKKYIRYFFKSVSKLWIKRSPYIWPNTNWLFIAYLLSHNYYSGRCNEKFIWSFHEEIKETFRKNPNLDWQKWLFFLYHTFQVDWVNGKRSTLMIFSSIFKKYINKKYFNLRDFSYKHVLSIPLSYKYIYRNKYRYFNESQRAKNTIFNDEWSRTHIEQFSFREGKAWKSFFNVHKNSFYWKGSKYFVWLMNNHDNYFIDSFFLYSWDMDSWGREDNLLWNWVTIPHPHPTQEKYDEDRVYKCIFFEKHIFRSIVINNSKKHIWI